jgi:hypothetical protein
VKSISGTTFRTQNATCSVSAKKFSTFRSSISLPTMRSGWISSGMIFVASSTSKSKADPVKFSLSIVLVADC